jgi:hypothetical protein
VASTAVLLVMAAGTVAVDREEARRSVTVSAAGDAEALAAELQQQQAATTTTAPPPPPSTTTAPTTAAPRPTTTTTKATPTAANAPPKSRVSYSGGLEPRVPGGVRHPYVAGQTVWSATSNGMVMTLRLDTSNPAAGAPVRVVMEATPPAGGACCFFHFGRDDGVTSGKQTVKGDGSDCVAPKPSVQRVETTVTFNKAGRVEFFFQASPLCLPPQDAGVIYGFVEVGAGRSTSQGPSLPVLTVHHAPQPPDPYVRGVAAFARDEDGYIAGFSVNWADGTPVETFPGDPLGCMQLPAGWPNPSQRPMAATNDVTKPPYHRFGQPGAYAVTVTVWSTGCDGGDEQRVSGSVTMHVT